LLSRLPVRDYEQGTIRLVDPADLVYAQRRDRRVVLHTPTTRFPTYYTITRLRQRLAHAGFFQASASAIINLECVEHLIPNGDGSYDALLRLGDQMVNVPISRSRSRELLRLLDVP